VAWWDAAIRMQEKFLWPSLRCGLATLAVFEIGFCLQQNNSGCPTLCGFQSVGA